MKFDDLNKQENVQYSVAMWAVEFKQFGPTAINNVEVKSVLLYHIF